jgi:putative nucleotidyltransferase with HDIG domain
MVIKVEIMAKNDEEKIKIINSQEEEITEKLEKKDPGPLDSHYPLWAEFREKASGSYKHTQSLINIVDNVASSIELDSPNLQLAARYHDIGKMWFPEAFTENQGKNSIHDHLEPWISYQLLTRHVSDTVVILISNDFPAEVIKIAAQHHGTTILKSIYEKALKDDPNIPESAFRYNTEKPSSIEALILMLCDQVEATSRSIYVDQQKDVEPDIFISNIFNKLMLDGQFDNVSLKLGHLSKIQKALAEDVAGNYQKRLKYEEDNELIKE